MSGFVFAQDTGTGLTSQDDADWTDAANLMAAVHSDNTTNYKVSGLNVTADFTAEEATVSPGQARIKAENISTVDHSSDGTKEILPYEWDEVTIAVVLTESNTVPINSTGTTDIYLDTNLDSGQPDQVEIAATEPTSPHIQIASVDNDEEVIDEDYNIYPDVSHEVLTATSIGEPSTPNNGEVIRWYDEVDEAYKMKFDDGSTITIAER